MDIHIIILLLYPVFGLLKTSDAEAVYRGLGRNEAERKANLKLFHQSFKNNNQKTRDSFYLHNLTQKLYPHILPFMTEEVVFGTKGPSAAVAPGYSLVTKQMRDYYHLPMPRWWTTAFPG